MAKEESITRDGLVAINTTSSICITKPKNLNFRGSSKQQALARGSFKISNNSHGSLVVLNNRISHELTTLLDGKSNIQAQ